MDVETGADVQSSPRSVHLSILHNRTTAIPDR